MKHFLLIIFFPFALFAINPITNDLPPKLDNIEQNVVAHLDNIIEATKTSLDEQTRLKQNILHYQKLQTSYINNPDDRVVLYNLVRSANQIQETIESNQLSYAFETEFLKELALFSRIAKKVSMPRP